MLSLRELLDYSRNILQDTMEVLEIRVNNLTSGYVETASDMTNTENNLRFDDLGIRKEFENVDQNRNGFFSSDTTQGGAPIDNFALTTKSIKNEKPTKIELNQIKEKQKKT